MSTTKKKSQLLDLNPRELATVLAALRIYQQQLNLNGGEVPSDVLDIANDGGTLEPMTEQVDEDSDNISEIDCLCEKLNGT